jgi:hypothetical protein
MPQNQPFDIPQELRQLAEQNVERARQLYLQFIEGVAQSIAPWVTHSSDSISAGFNRVRARAVKFAKENADAAFKLAREVAKAKDLQELLGLQTRYVQSQMRWYADQTQEFGQLMTGALGNMKEAQGLQSDARSSGPQTPGKEITKETTNLKLISFSIEVETDPVTLLMQTDKGPFSVEIPKTELSNLVYALQIVSYADEPLREKRLRRQAEGSQSFASVGTPKEKEDAKLVKRPSRANERKGGKKQK